MNNLINLDQMLNDMKAKSEDAKLTINAAEKTVKIINKIVKAREDLGWTQRNLAEKCGIKQPALARIETCKVIPQLNTIIKIAEAVGINIEAFTSTEKQQLNLCYSISQAVINTTFYNNREGDYLWK